MNSELQYDNLIEELDKAFPEFLTYLGDSRGIVDDNEYVYLTCFYSNYTYENWQDKALQNRVVAFMERMQQSSDQSLQTLFDNFLLELYLNYEEGGVNIQPLFDQLSIATRNRMVYNYNHWIEGMSQAEKRSR